MKEYLFSREGTFYKANLHAHSTISDGHLTPEQMRDAYKAHGYSILAITDHELLRDHSDLSTDDFLMLNGYEIYLRENQNELRFSKTSDLNLIARTPAPHRQVCVDPTYFRYGKKNNLTAEDTPHVGKLCDRRYGARCINCIIRTAVENDFIVAYNHPRASLESIEEVGACHGMYAMEIYNHASSTTTGMPGDDAHLYDQLLRQGQMIACIANDDNHNPFPLDDPMSDSFGGFTMIRAGELTYGAVIEALEKGQCYASQGPEIHEMYIEDGYLHLFCSSVSRIDYTAGGRTNVRGHMRYYAAAEDESLSEAVIPILHDDRYFRIELTDAQGKKAWTRAYQLISLQTNGIEE